jgi:hypothetical protein
MLRRFVRIATAEFIMGKMEINTTKQLKGTFEHWKNT